MGKRLPANGRLTTGAVCYPINKIVLAQDRLESMLKMFTRPRMEEREMIRAVRRPLSESQRDTSIESLFESFLCGANERMSW